MMQFAWDWETHYSGQFSVTQVHHEKELWDILISDTIDQGTRSLVAYVTNLTHDERYAVSTRLAEVQDDLSIEYSIVLHLIMRYDHQITDMLNCFPIEQLVVRLEALMKQNSKQDQFAIMTCLYMAMSYNPRAQVSFFYLLRIAPTLIHPLQHLLTFHNSLTPTQQHVAVLASQGHTNKEIAETLFITSGSIADHLTEIYDKYSAMVEQVADSHATRYRLIHHMTRLYEQYPYLRDGVLNR